MQFLRCGPLPSTTTLLTSLGGLWSNGHWRFSLKFRRFRSLWCLSASPIFPFLPLQPVLANPARSTGVLPRSLMGFYEDALGERYDLACVVVFNPQTVHLSLCSNSINGRFSSPALVLCTHCPFFLCDLCCKERRVFHAVFAVLNCAPDGTPHASALQFPQNSDRLGGVAEAFSWI